MTNSKLRSDLQAYKNSVPPGEELEDELTEWVDEYILQNVLNMPLLEFHEPKHGDAVYRKIEMNPPEDWTGKNSEVEELGIENLFITDIDFNTDTITMVAYADWQPPHKFSITRRYDGKYIYNNDITAEDSEEDILLDVLKTL